MIYTPGDTYALMVCAFLVGVIFGWRRRGKTKGQEKPR